MKRLMIGCVALAGAAPAFAQADAGEATTGVYAALHGGFQGISDPKGTFFDEPGAFGGTGPGNDTIRARFHAKGGASIGGTVGYDFGPVRFDLDVTYGRNKLNRLTIRDVNGTAPTGLTDADAQAFCDYLADTDVDEDEDGDVAADGDAPACTLRGGNTIDAGGSFAKLRQIGAIASLWYDIPLHSRVEPYVGAGIGAVGYHVETGGDGDGKVKFAYQLGAGLAFKLSPHVALTADYRYRRVGGTTLFADEGSGLALKAIKTSLVSGGVRFTF